MSAHFHVSWLSDFIFYPKPLYKSFHQSFFYSFITILPPRKWCYTRVEHDFHIDPIVSPCQFIFQPFVTWLRENYDYRNVSWKIICIYDLTLSRGECNTCSFRSPWVTLPLNLFFPTHLVLFPFVLIWAVDGTVLSCRIRFISSSVWFVCYLRMQIIWHTALSSSHHAMRCCHHSVSIARSRLMAEK